MGKVRLLRAKSAALAPEIWMLEMTTGAVPGLLMVRVLAVLVVFAGRVRSLVVNWRDPGSQRYLVQLAVAFALTGIGGVVLKKLGFKLPETTAPVAWATLVGGVLFLVVERWLRGRPTTDQIGWGVAVVVGVAQLLAAVFPGASRSGTTILVAIAMGVARPAATEFSFLLGIPTLLAAGGLQIVSAVRHPSGDPVVWPHVILGLVVSGVAAFGAVKWLLRYVQTHSFEAFGWYRVAIGIVILLWG